MRKPASLPAEFATTPMPDSAPELARRAWELHEQAVAVGDYSSATRLLRTCCELTGVLGEAQRRKRSTLADRLKTELAALDAHVEP